VITVLVTTKHRGVFGGLVPDDQNMNAEVIALKEARMAIYWGTTKGLHELCDTGPTSSSLISAPADIDSLRDITAIFTISDDAWKKWVVA